MCCDILWLCLSLQVIWRDRMRKSYILWAVLWWCCSCWTTQAEIFTSISRFKQPCDIFSLYRFKSLMNLLPALIWSFVGVSSLSLPHNPLFYTLSLHIKKWHCGQYFACVVYIELRKLWLHNKTLIVVLKATVDSFWRYVSTAGIVTCCQV